MGEFPRQRCQHGYVIDPEDPCPECERDVLKIEVQALRQARLDALEEAARMVESGLGEYFTAGHIRALKDKQS